MISAFVQVEAVVFSVMIAWGFWGFHTILFGWLVAVVGRRHTIRRFLLVACCAGYLISTVTIALYSFVAWEHIRLGYSKASRLITVRRVAIPESFVWSLAVTISDAVQMWRCTVLCSERKVVVVALGFLLASTAAVGVVNDVLSIVFYYNPKFASPDVIQRLGEGAVLAFLLPSALLNIIATSMILTRVYAHSKDIMTSLGPEHRSLKRLRLLSIFLLEGGVVYTAIQIMYAIVSILSIEGNQHATIPLATRPVVVVISCMYPLTITLFAELARHMTDVYTRKNASAESSSIGLPLPRAHWPILRSRPSAGQVALTVSQTKFVDKVDSQSAHETDHSVRESGSVA